MERIASMPNCFGILGLSSGSVSFSYCLKHLSFILDKINILIVRGKKLFHILSIGKMLHVQEHESIPILYYNFIVQGCI